MAKEERQLSSADFSSLTAQVVDFTKKIAEECAMDEVEAQNIAVSLTLEERQLIVKCSSCDEFKLRAEVEISHIESKRKKRLAELEERLRKVMREDLVSELSGIAKVNDGNFVRVKQCASSLQLDDLVRVIFS